MLSVIGGSDRTGRWCIGSKLTAVTLMGGTDLDLRHAELDAGGIAVLGSNDQCGSVQPGRPGFPTVRRAWARSGGHRPLRLTPDGSE